MEKQIDDLKWQDEVSPEEEASEFDFLLCVRVLLSYWWILAPLALIGAASGIAFCYFTQPVYRGICRYEVFQNVMLDIGDTVRRRQTKDSNLWRHILNMKSHKLNQKVIQELTEEWVDRIPEKFDRFKLSIHPVKEAPGSMLDISVDSFSKDYSIRYIDKLIEGFEHLRREETELLMSNTLSNLRQELKGVSRQLDKVQNDIVEFETDHNIYFVHEKTKSDQQLLATLMRHQSKLRTQIAILDAQFPFLKNENAATLRDVINLTNQLSQTNPTPIANGSARMGESPSSKGNDVILEGWSEIPEWRKNEALIMRLAAEYEHLLETYKPGHVKMIELEKKIDTAKMELQISSEISLKRLQSIRDALKMQEKALLGTAQDFRMEINLNSGQRAEYDKLKSNAEYLRSQHKDISQRIMDSVVASSDRYYTRIVEGPMVLANSVWPVKWKMISMSICGFMGTGAGLILLSYFIKVRLYDFQSLERALNLNCLAGIPQFKNVKSDRKNPLNAVTVLKDKSDFASECYRSLRTNIEQKMGPNDKILMLTSPDPGEGKTFTVLNLAIVFSWNRKKVLIIDGDFRRRTFRKLFKNAPSKGLIDCLSPSQAKWKDCVIPSVIPDIDYLPAGKLSQHTTELLTLPTIATIFKEINEQYDMVIIDSAPVNRVVDTMVLAEHADIVVLIAKAGKTKTHSMRYCHSRLSKNNIVGYILNNIDAASRKYGYYSYGNSYYSTYHQYKSYYRDDHEEEKEKKV